MLSLKSVKTFLGMHSVVYVFVDTVVVLSLLIRSWFSCGDDSVSVVLAWPHMLSFSHVDAYVNCRFKVYISFLSARLHSI